VSHIAFEPKTIKVPLAALLPTRIVPLSIRQSPKFKTILASIQEIVIIEPLAVFPNREGGVDADHYFLLDGHLRLEALKVLGSTDAICLVSPDGEGFTYNRQTN